jgi:uncharacterized membrane protein
VIAVPAYRYLAHTGPVPANIAANRHVSPWLVIHATASATALLLGPFQFLTALRRRSPRVHRWLGRCYVAACFIGGAAGLILATGVSAGPIAGAGFFALAVAWLTTTAVALIAARARRFERHRRWMIRSYALAFAAVTLRLYLPFSIAMGFDILIAYRAIAWLCWLPNAAVAELWLKIEKAR